MRSRTLLLPVLSFGLSFVLSLLIIGKIGQRSPSWAATPGLSVVRSPDNADEWQGITQRLDALGIAYDTIDWATVRQASDLAKTRILFLPNVETWTKDQIAALETWLQNGGEVIVSGSIGTDTRSRERSRLDALLGASWSMALPPLASLQAIDCLEANLCTAPPDWIPPDSSTGAIRGGILTPIDDTAQTAMAWQIAGKAPAVVTTDRATFFGWEWGAGNPDSIAFDTTWLGAAIGRIDPTLLASAQPRQPAPTPTAAPPHPIQEPETLTDPDSQVAAPGLRVELSDRPLSAIEVRRMQRELTQLLGRVESAALAAEAQEWSVGDHRKDDKPNPNATAAVPETTALAAAINTARNLLLAFPNLVAGGQYETARRQWLQARELLWEQYPNDRPRATAEIRAIWLDRGTIVKAGSPEGLARVFDRLHAAGINTVFLETVNAGYPIYPSQVAPEQNPLTLGWDPLQAAIELAHARNMELHAWMWTFAVGNERHNLLVGKPADYPGPVLAAHPDWANRDDKGRVQHRASGKFFLDPANSQARAYLRQIANEIATQYDVDGLQLDYIRYPFQDPSAERTYGYGAAGRSQFQQQAGVDPLEISPDDRELWQQWTDFRTGQIDSFVADISELLHRENPDLTLSVAVFSLTEHERIHKLQQHWENWIDSGTVDLVVLMSYALDTNRLQALVEPLLAQSSDVPIIPSVKLHDLSAIEAIDQLQALRDLPSTGYALFAAEMLRDSLHTVLVQTQPPDAAQPLPHRQPFAAARDRFLALRREWELLFAEERVWLPEQELGELNAQVDELEKALQQLEAQPNSANIARVRAQLSAFGTAFDRVLVSLSGNAYRAETWKNRLLAIEVLLQYGENQMD
jgi:uncharacterized lipoprotein YddW (UPF0748 family)